MIPEDPVLSFSWKIVFVLSFLQYQHGRIAVVLVCVKKKNACWRWVVAAAAAAAAAERPLPLRFRKRIPTCNLNLVFLSSQVKALRGATSESYVWKARTECLL